MATDTVHGFVYSHRMQLFIGSVRLKQVKSVSILLVIKTKEIFLIFYCLRPRGQINNATKAVSV